ncbi:MAG: UvrD-helicase domain-containing protein [Spirochaetales bacterium]|nr:UvrD-helicase domain-containing protein [Spirochaetales bacterium]
MRFIGDFHIHSHYSRATSRDLTPENLALWGQRKGLAVVGTGDFTHPGWTAELKEKLQGAEEGLFVLKEPLSGDRGASTRFLLTAEISTIYKYGEKVRKVHHLIFAPGFETVFRIQQKIERLGGNIRSDGRPILGMDSRDLLELCLEADEDILFVPAHIWTPWFSALGSKSGFDTIRECYRDLADHIFAVETGLSSDPPMNWICSFLDDYTVISNSDAHSPEKLGRESCLFDTGLSYPEITGALKEGRKAGFRGTVEFFPQEGKYHHDGHRKCGVSWDPLTTERHGGICPVCGKPVTVGVLNRIAQLADRRDITERPERDPFYSLIPLKEILAELEGVGAGSKKVGELYDAYLRRLGSELDILLRLDLEDLRHEMGPEAALSIQRMRERRVQVSAGYDGEYGRVNLLCPGEAHAPGAEEGTLFGEPENPAGEGLEPLEFLEFDVAAYREEKKIHQNSMVSSINVKDDRAFTAGSKGLNPEQKEAVMYNGGMSLILAGPGTGKTRTVVEKILHLVRTGTAPEGIIAVTFANKAAGQLRERIEAAGIAAADRLFEPGKVGVFTFHGLGLAILKEQLPLLGRDDDFSIIDEDEQAFLVTEKTECSAGDRKKLIEYAGNVKSGLLPVPDDADDDYNRFRGYQDMLKRNNCFDYDDLVYLPVRLFEGVPGKAEAFQERIHHLIVDEYQDINPMQHALLRLLAKNASICAVGDRNQSIYSFRGGSPESIDRFTLDFPGARVFHLSRSYRCPDTFLKAASQVLGEGESLLTGLAEEVSVRILKAPSAASEAEQLARDMEERSGGMGFFSLDSHVADSSTEGDTSLSEIAVLCRTSLLMPPLEKAFRDHRIPYRIIRAESLFKKEPYRSFFSFVRSSRRKSRLLDPPPVSLEEALEGFAASGNLRAGESDLMDMKTDLSPYWKEGEGVREFLEHARLGSDLDRYDPRIQAVTVMTIHAAKGLEFDTVYIPGCEDSVIPCSLAGEEVKDEEEEKRLLYVAMTRAKGNLILSYAEKRTIFGKTRPQKQSPFLISIEKDLLKRQEVRFQGDRGKTLDQLLLFKE